jgi:hypothetical protein
LLRSKSVTVNLKPDSEIKLRFDGHTRRETRERIRCIIFRYYRPVLRFQLGVPPGTRPSLTTLKDQTVRVRPLPDQGVNDVALIPLQTIPGHEYHDLLRTAAAFTRLPKGLSKVEVSAPLLFPQEDFPQVARALLDGAPEVAARGKPSSPLTRIER